MKAANQRPKASILIVDDTPANLLLLERMLTDRGYRPRPFSSGSLALEAAQAERPDLILLDINMPGMNGYEVCAHLKADPKLRDVPVVFISASNEVIDKVKAFGAGGADYVTKPFQFEEVFARIKTHLHLCATEKLRDDLTHMVVHDLRNPLAVISSFLDVLELNEARQLSPGTRNLVAVARTSVRDMLELIGSMLDVSKMGAGELKLQCEPCNLDTLSRTVLAANRPLPGHRTVRIDVSGSPDISGDIPLLRRVIQNLLTNALKFAPAGSEVLISVATDGNDVRLSVTDTGPGIAREHRERIFEKFGQVEVGTNRVGTGLGLTFCKLVVETHGGRIGVDSELGKGSTFWLALPCLVAVPVAV